MQADEERIRSKQSLGRLSWVLIILHGFLGIGAIIGGGGLIIDPSGNILQMPNSLLEHSPFRNFLIPGIVLLLVLGIMPIVIAISLVTQCHWKIGVKLNLYPDRHWAWTFSLYTGFALHIWIMVQVFWIQHVSVIHLVYFAWGIAIQVVTLLPGVQQRYSR
ncbi:hypothetical protein [Paenibacillus sp. 7516]|uniref:hypothetical protein n=1 Tax=Paenibacillus sp. 7516 TaxID=2022549 RepID=UPI000BA7230A|nr:hypothetical protein [Paenibacillus sp. 7516]PAF30432.1 hypothetical protein CHI14_16915 [Paenibacillus sp. 7516]